MVIVYDNYWAIYIMVINEVLTRYIELILIILLINYLTNFNDYNVYSILNNDINDKDNSVDL